MAALPACLQGVQSCQDNGWLPDECLEAFGMCTLVELKPEITAGRNAYDSRKVCYKENPVQCYDFSAEIAFLNDRKVKKALGVPAGQARWSPCNYVTSLDFARSGDWLQSTNGLVAKMLERGVAVLAYSGDTDLMVDWLGTKSWMTYLSWSGAKGFAQVTEQPFVVGRKAQGRFRSFGGFTFLQIFNAGHMVPMDQPEAALGMVMEFVSEESPWRHTRRKAVPVHAFAQSYAPILLFMALSLPAAGLPVMIVMMSRNWRKNSDSNSGSYVILD